MVAVFLLVLGGPAHAAQADCGTPGAGAPGAAPVRADLTPLVPTHTISLGRSLDGVRQWEVEFGWTSDCVPRLSSGDARIRLLQGTDASLSGAGIRSTVEVDELAHRAIVTINLDRAAIPPGTFEGTLELGNGVTGIGKAGVIVTHQEPLATNELSTTEQIAWVGAGVVLAGLLFMVARLAGAESGGRRSSKDFTTPLAIIVLALAAYPLVANLRQDKEVPAPSWPVWLGVLGLMGGFLVGVIKHRASGGTLVGGYRFASAIVLSFGAGVAAWRAEYLNTPGWALNLESALTLLSVVGGATAAAALLLLVPSTEGANDQNEGRRRAHAASARGPTET